MKDYNQYDVPQPCMGSAWDIGEIRVFSMKKRRNADIKELSKRTQTKYHEVRVTHMLPTSAKARVAAESKVATSQVGNNRGKGIDYSIAY